MPFLARTLICRSIFLIIFVLSLFAFSGCEKKVEIPNRGSALDQFYYAMETFYFPAESAEGKSKTALIENAAQALAKVHEYFPSTDDNRLVAMETDFYRGICLKTLGRFDEAVESFYRCFSTDVSLAAINDYEADTISYKNDAWYALMELREYLSPEYLQAVDLYRPEK